MLLGLGCGEEPTPTRAPLGDFCVRYAEARCAGQASCCTADLECVAGWKTRCEAETDELTGIVLAGNAALVPAAVASCEAALRAASEGCALPDPVTVASTGGAIVAEAVPIGGFCQAGKDALPCADGAGRCRGGAKGAICTTVVMQDGACRG